MITLYTDGSCRGNPGPGGWALIRLDEEDDKLVMRPPHFGTKEQTTNNEMELRAVLEAAEMAKKDPDLNHYTCFCDSAYVVNICNEWMIKWAMNGWRRSKNQPIENLKLVKALYERFIAPFFNLSLEKIKGHNGCLGNELADALATDNKEKVLKLSKANDIYYQENDDNIPVSLCEYLQHNNLTNKKNYDIIY